MLARKIKIAIAVVLFGMGAMVGGAAEGNAQDNKVSIEALRKAADQGNAEAQANLGAAYHNGEGVEKDYKEAVKWYRKAADQGDATGQFLLGRSYNNGQGVEKNNKEAVNWWRKAADQGYPLAQFVMGKAYHNGSGVEKDDKQAIIWWIKAAAQGNAASQTSLGLANHEGFGVEKDDKVAVLWFRKAAEQNNADALYNLGVAYHEGWSVKKDDKQAVVWWRKAAEKGNTDAQKSLELYATSEPSSADDPSQKEYKKLLENYYFLDKQKAGHISCGISVPALQDFIDILRQTSAGMFSVDDNLRDFSVTYDRTKGVFTNSPHINVSFLPNEKFADVGRLENWRRGMKKATNERVLVAKAAIAMILSEMSMISYSPEKLKNLSLTKNSDATVVSFDEAENAHARVIYSGSTQKLTESSPTSSLTVTSDYQPLNGKLALAHSAMESTQGSQKINGTESISYQDLGSTFFPAQILVNVTASDGTQQPKPQHVEIDFKDCKTSDLSP